MRKFILFLLMGISILQGYSQAKEGRQVLQVLNRLYVQDVEQAIAFYEELLGEKVTLRFAYKEAGLELAQVGSLLLLAGTEEALQPFRETTATFIVDSIERFRTYLLANGATVVRDIKIVPTGQNMTMRHADGVVVEYVEFKKEE